MLKYWLVITVSMTIACNKVFDVPCPTTDEDEGLVVESFEGLDQSCDSFSGSRFENISEGVIIQSLEELQGGISMISPTGLICDVPKIDFDQYSLLGLSTQGTGCTRTYRRSVSASSDGLLFEVTVRECGGCEPLEFITHWVTVPKIDADAKVRFSIKTQKFNS